MTDLGTLPGSNTSLATGINDNGEVVGQGVSTPAGLPGGFVWRNGTMRLLGGPGIISPTGVNVHGDICIYFQKAPGADTDALLLVNGHRHVVRRGAVANAVNDFGAVVGWFDNGNGPIAYLWHLSTGMLVPLSNVPGAPAEGTQAYGVNNHRQVAGLADVPESQFVTVPRAVLWTSDGQPHLLPGFASNNNIAQANDVNNVGQLTGFAVTPTGQHAVLWTA
jgi:probable HAF family extracellular repeat protein